MHPLVYLGLGPWLGLENRVDLELGLWLDWAVRFMAGLNIYIYDYWTSLS